MRKLTVDRIEPPHTICKDKDHNYFAIETSEMPEGVRQGTRITINDDGVISVDK